MALSSVSRTSLRRAMATPPSFTQSAIRNATLNAARTYASSSGSKSLKDTFKASLPEKIEQIKKLKKDYGSKVIGEVTLDQVYGGARGIKSLVWEVGINQIGVWVGRIDQWH